MPTPTVPSLVSGSEVIPFLPLEFADSWHGFGRPAALPPSPPQAPLPASVIYPP